MGLLNWMDQSLSSRGRENLMNLRANPESKFLLKYLVIGLGCVAFAGWSLYDGLVVAPNKIPRAQAWAELQEEKLISDEENKKWKEISKENGWSSKRPNKDESVESIQHFITYQYRRNHELRATR